LLGRRLERGEGVIPEPVEVRAQRRHPLRVELVDPPRAQWTHEHDPGLPQHLQVLRDGGPADRELGGELADGLRARREPLEDLPARAVAQRLHCLVSVHLR